MSLVTKSSPALCNPMDCSLPGSSAHGFPRQEYWSMLPFPPAPVSIPGSGSESPALAGRFLTAEPPGNPLKRGMGHAIGCSSMSYLAYTCYCLPSKRAILRYLKLCHMRNGCGTQGCHIRKKMEKGNVILVYKCLNSLPFPFNLFCFITILVKGVTIYIVT